MKKIFKKLLCSLLAVLMIVSIAPIRAEAATVTSTKEEAVETGVYQKILEVVEEMKTDFPNNVFSVNGKDCYVSGVSHGCYNCYLPNIVEDKLKEKSWVTQKIITAGDYDSWQCNGFAKYAFVRIFGSLQTGKFTRYENIGSGSKASTYSKCKTGDIIFTSKHAMIYLWHDSTGVTVLDANGYGDLKIRFEEKYSYSHGNLSGSVNIRRANNWDEIDKKYGHSYDDYGYCSHCKKYYEQINANKIVSVNGTATKITFSKFYIKAHPYKAGANQDELVAEECKVIGKIVNHKGNTWYKISYGSSKTGWIDSNNYKIDINNTINIELNMNKSSIPKGTSVWANDSSKAYNWYGKASSSNGVSKITSLTFEILKADGTLTASTNRITIKPNATSYTVKTSDDTTKFSELAVGSDVLSLSATDENGKTANKKYNFTVYDNASSKVSVTGVNITQTSVTVSKGKTSSLTATVSPSNATNKAVTWSSSNTSVATVSSSGVVTGVSAGTAVITVTTKDGSYKDTCIVEVKESVAIPVTDVVIVDEESRNYNDKYQMVAGSSWQFGLEFFPYNATNKNVTWSSSNTSVATVSSSGLVKAIGEGKANIKVTTQEGGFTSTIEVEVVEDTRFVRFVSDGSALEDYHIPVGDTFVIPNKIPTRPGYTFEGWQESGTAGTNGWVTTKPASGTYQTGYKYYIWGYECDHCRDYGYNYDVDYTFFYSKNKNDVISGVKANPQVYGSYTPSKLRYFYIIESANKGTSFYPGQSGSTYKYFNADYIAEDGKKGTASIYKTEFYLESTVYKQEATGGKIYQPGDSYNVKNDVTFTAIWKEVKGYNITFDPANGTGGPANMTTNGTEFTVPKEIPVRENWKFLYWMDQHNGKFEPGETVYIFEDRVLTACWAPYWFPEIKVGNTSGKPGETVAVPVYIYNAKEPNNTTVKFSVTSDGLTRTKYENAAVFPENGLFTTVYFEIPKTAKTGTYPVNFNLTEYKVLSGYYLTETVEITNGVITVEEPEPKTYTISYNANGGSGAPSAQTKTENKALTLSTTKPTRNGYEFLGWAAYANAGTAQYQPGGSYNENANVTLYAVWKQKEVIPADAPTIIIGEVSGRAGETVEVPVYVKNNPNMAVIGFDIEYDDEYIKLTDYKNSGLSDWLIGIGEGEKANWINEKGSSFNGEMLVLVFEVKEGIKEAEAEILFTNIKSGNVDGEKINFIIENGKIVISSGKPGDSNNDGEVDVFDLLVLRKHLAGMSTTINTGASDVNSDGEVDVFDLLMLRKYLAGMKV